MITPSLGEYKADWQTVTADNGAAYQIDMKSISHFNNGAADVVVYAVEGREFNPENMHRLWFDCQGRFRDETGPRFGPTLYVAPSSIAGRVGGIACAGAKDTRFVEPSRPEPKDTPAYYCTGFSAAACTRITAAKTKAPPGYCKPGYDERGSGLSPEQVRICEVATREATRRAGTKNNRAAESSPTNSTYNLTLSATRTYFPTIMASTNLPDGTQLRVAINKPRLPNAPALLAAGLPMCEEDCLPASGPKGELLGVRATVQSGGFSAGPFSWAGKPFRKGSFDVEIYLVALPGENITAPENLEKLLERSKRPLTTMAVAVDP